MPHIKNNVKKTMLPIHWRTRAVVKRDLVFGPLFEPTEIIATVWRILRRSQSRSEPIDLFFWVIVRSYRTVTFGFLHQNRLLNGSHDNSFWWRLGNAVRATVAYDQKRLLSGIFWAKRVQVDVMNEAKWSRITNRCSANLK